LVNIRAVSLGFELFHLMIEPEQLDRATVLVKSAAGAAPDTFVAAELADEAAWAVARVGVATATTATSPAIASERRVGRMNALLRQAK
jgi:hypothetical protein